MKKEFLIFFITIIFLSCQKGEKNNLESLKMFENGFVKTSSNCYFLDNSFKEKDSIVWNGKCKNKKADGFGTLEKYNDKGFVYKYEGEIEAGRKIGFGKETYLNGSVYEGQFYFNPHGQGKKTNLNGTTFHGIFNSGQEYTGVNYLASGEKIYISERKNISKDSASIIGMDKWSGDQNNYQLNYWIDPKLNIESTIFYDENWRITKNRNSAYFYRLVTFLSTNKVKDNLIKDFFITGELQNKYYAEYVDVNDSSLDIREGEDIIYFQNGNVSNQSFFKNGKKNGKEISYFEDGSIKSTVNFMNGLEEGKYLSYWSNGNKEREMYYESGILNGERKYYYENGTLRTIQFSKNNKNSGNFAWYYQSGELELRQKYTDGYMIPGERYEYEKDGSGKRVYQENWLWNYDDWEKKGNGYHWHLDEKNNFIISQNEKIYHTKPIGIIDPEKTFTIELSFKKIEGENSEGTGVIFNYKDDDNYSSFLVSSDGYYRVDNYFLGLSKVVKEWTKSRFVNKSNQENKMKVFKLKDKVYYSINGNIVFSSKLQAGKGNEFGIIADAGSFEIASLELTQPFSKEENNNEKSDNSSFSNSSMRWKTSGSGIVISESGFIATNHHVIKNSNYIEIELPYKGSTKSFRTKIIKTDHVNDLAILKIDDPKFYKFNTIPYNFITNIKKTGAKIYSLGFPNAISSDGSDGLMGKEIKFTDGRISSRTGIAGSEVFYQTTVPLQSGNSGGPLFDENANLVGINTAVLRSDEFENVSYSVKTRYLYDLIKSLSEKINLPNNKRTGRLDIENQVEILSKFVPLIKVK